MQLAAKSNFERFTVRHLLYLQFIGIPVITQKTLFHTVLQGFIALFIPTLLVLQVAFLCLPHTSRSDRSECVTYINYYTVGFGKIVAMTLNRQGLIRSHENLKARYPRVDLELRYNLEHYLHTYAFVEQFLSKFFTYIVIFYLSYPIAQSLYDLWTFGAYTYHMPILMWYPIPIEQSYFIVVAYFFIESFGSLIMGSAILAADLCLFSSVSQLALHFDLLAQRIAELKPEQPESLQQLKELIQYHQMVLKLADDVNYIFTPSIMFSLMSSSFIICFSAYQLLDDVSLLVVVKILFLLGYELKQVVITCYFGDKLIQTSSRLFDVVYAHDWFKGSEEYKRIMLIMLMRVRKPFMLNVAGIAKISLITLKEVLSLSYQIFAVLKTT